MSLALANHETLQASGTIVIIWLAALGVILGDHSDFPYPVNWYFIVSISVGLLIFSAFYFYWKSGHPIRPLLLTATGIVFGVLELLGSATLLYLALQFVRIFFIIALNPQVLASTVSAQLFVFVVVVIAIASMLVAIGTVFGFDAVGRITGKWILVKPPRLRMKNLENRTSITVLNCSRCKSRYPASDTEISFVRKNRTHSIPCQYCGSPATISEERI